MRRARRPRRVLIALGSIALLAAAERHGIGAMQGRVTGSSSVYLRSGPGAESKTVGTLAAGDKIVILSTQGVWTKVATHDGRVGYLNRRFVTLIAEGEEEPSPEPTAAEAEEEAPAAAVPAPAASATPELTAEMADLRAEIADLKRKIGEQRSVEAPEARPPADAAAASPIPAPSAVRAPDGEAAASAREQGAGALAVGLLGLIVGWVLGSTFTRRRSRSQRSRLRF